MPSLSVDLRHTVHRTNHSDKHWGTAIVPVLSSPWGHVQVSILYERMTICKQSQFLTYHFQVGSRLALRDQIVKLVAKELEINIDPLTSEQ